MRLFHPHTQPFGKAVYGPIAYIVSRLSILLTWISQAIDDERQFLLLRRFLFGLFLRGFPFDFAL
jgi:hypothetical protein